MTDEEQAFLDKYSAPAAAPALADDEAAFLRKYSQPVGSGVSMPPGLDESTGALEHGSRVALGAGIDTTSSFLGIPKMLTGLYTAGLNKLLPKGHQIKDVLGAPFPDSARVREDLSAMLPGRAEPMNNFERYGIAVPVRAIPMAAATIASGGAAGPAIAGNLAGELGGEAGGQLFPDSWWGPLLGGLATSLGTAGLAKVGKNFVEAKQAAGALKDASSALDAAKVAVADAKYNNPGMLAEAENGLKDAQDVAASRLALVKQKQAIIRDGDIKQADAAAATAQTSAKQQIEQTAASLHPAQNLQEAGEFAQGEARNWLTKTLPAKQSAAWAPVDAKIAGDSPTPLAGTLAAVKDINSSAGELEGAASLLKPKLPQDFQKALEKVLESPGETLGGRPIAWQDVQKLRSALGDALSNPKTINDIGEQNAKRIYAALTSDMRSAASKAGALPEFDAANAESTRLYDLAQGPVSKIISGKTASLEHDPAAGKVASSFLAGGKLGDTDLAAIASEMPQVPKAFAAAHLRENLGKPQAWNQLSDQARSVLVPDPTARASLESAVDAHTQAPLQAKDLKTAANAAYKGKIDEIQNDTGIGLTAKQQELRDLKQKTAADALARQQANAEAQAKFDKAQTALAAKPNVSDWGHAAARIGLGEFADQGASLLHPLVQHSLPGNLGLMLGLGAAAPPAFRGLKQVLSDPQMRQGLLGGLLGSETAADANASRKR